MQDNKTLARVYNCGCWKATSQQGGGVGIIQEHNCNRLKFCIYVSETCLFKHIG